MIGLYGLDEVRKSLTFLFGIYEHTGLHNFVGLGLNLEN